MHIVSQHGFAKWNTHMQLYTLKYTKTKKWKMNSGLSTFTAQSPFCHHQRHLYWRRCSHNFLCLRNFMFLLFRERWEKNVGKYFFICCWPTPAREKPKAVRRCRAKESIHVHTSSDSKFLWRLTLLDVKLQTVTFQWLALCVQNCGGVYAAACCWQVMWSWESGSALVITKRQALSPPCKYTNTYSTYKYSTFWFVVIWVRFFFFAGAVWNSAGLCWNILDQTLLTRNKRDK